MTTQKQMIVTLTHHNFKALLANTKSFAKALLDSCADDDARERYLEEFGTTKVLRKGFEVYHPLYRSESGEMHFSVIPQEVPAYLKRAILVKRTDISRITHNKVIVRGKEYPLILRNLGSHLDTRRDQTPHREQIQHHRMTCPSSPYKK